jgi:cell division protein FtsW
MRLRLLLFLTTISLALIGIFILYESSTYTALINVGDKYYFVKNQIMWVILGVILCLGVSRIPYKKFYPFALPLLLVTLALLVAVFIPGIGVRLKGASRWIDTGFSLFQPSELLKISLTLYLAAWLSSVKEKGRFLAFMLLVGICGGLVIIEPDMGTAFIVTGGATIVYFLSGVQLKEMVLIGLTLLVGIFVLVGIEPYRVARLTSFQNFDKHDLSGTSYHVKQVLIALGSGGLMGVGLGQSIQKYAYLPESTTDSIFAIYAEETGFVGTLFIISVFIFQLILGFAIAARAPDLFGRLLAVGITSFISIQALINFASQAVLMPLTGVPLPFISYGGSSMVINFISIGILLSIAGQIKGAQR